MFMRHCDVHCMADTIPFMRSGKPKKPYYYASGKRVTLEPAADVVALNEPLLAEKFPDFHVEKAAQGTGPLAGGKIRLVSSDAFDKDTLSRMKNAGVAQTVYRQEGAILVILPEIRVED